jgi:hypothetical protein
MATYRDPVRCFAPLEVIERLLEIRVEAGYASAIYLLSPDDLAAYLDAFGFDVYALTEAESGFHFGDYRAPLAPGGDHAHSSLTTHWKFVLKRVTLPPYISFHPMIWQPISMRSALTFML